MSAPTLMTAYWGFTASKNSDDELPALPWCATLRTVADTSTFADNTVKAAALQTTQRLYEFMDPRVSKTRGLVRVAELNDMELQNICVFGDADNDTCMVADAGVGVAMANGSDATRAAADFVTESNDEDGIAIFIQEHLL